MYTVQIIDTELGYAVLMPTSWVHHVFLETTDESQIENRIEALTGIRPDSIEWLDECPTCVPDDDD